MFLKLTGILCIASIAFALLAVSIAAQPPAVKAQTVAPSDSTRAALQAAAATIFAGNCRCHTGRWPKENMRLTAAAMVKSTVNVPSHEIHSLMRINTQDPEKSYLLMKIRGAEGIKGKRMPRGQAPLAPDQIQTIEAWIAGLSATGGASGK